jgi:D-aspartate ligase
VKEVQIMSNNQPSIIILDGAENSLSIVRSMGKRGIPVSVVAIPTCQAFNSRFIDKSFIVPEEMLAGDYYKEVLLGKDSDVLEGSVLLACGDSGIEFIIENHAALSNKYLLDIQKPDLQKALLNKQETLRMAKEAGIGFPDYWNINSLDDIEEIADQVNYPAIIKPIHSHLFVKIFDKKLFQVNNADELREKAALVDSNGLEFMVSELIPGPDTLLSSYYTHIDDDGHSLFKFTKQIIRRMPINFGSGCCHVTKWHPETAERGEHFFRSIGFTGMANIEFKKDLRDGELKIIECNTRYTAAQELVTRSGIDMPYLIYCFLIKQKAAKDGSDKATAANTAVKQTTVTRFTENLYYWYPREDFRSFLARQSLGELTLLQWLKSVAHFPVVFPCWSFNDPKPSIMSLAHTISNRVNHLKPWH